MMRNKKDFAFVFVLASLAAWFIVSGVFRQSAGWLQGNLGGINDVVRFDVPETGPITLKASDFGVVTGASKALEDGSVVFTTNGRRAKSITFPGAGPYIFKITAKGNNNGGAWPNLMLSMDDKEAANITIDNPTYKIFEVPLIVTNKSHWLSFSFTNDFYQPPLDRDLYVKSVEVEAAQ